MIRRSTLNQEEPFIGQGNGETSNPFGDYLEIVIGKKYLLINTLVGLCDDHLSVITDFAPEWQIKTVLLVGWASFILPATVSIVIIEAIGS